jgi:hypothetical protein
MSSPDIQAGRDSHSSIKETGFQNKNHVLKTSVRQNLRHGYNVL